MYLLLSQVKFSLSEYQVFPQMPFYINKVCVLFVSKKNCSNSGGKESSNGSSREEGKKSVKLQLSTGNSGNEAKKTFLEHILL